jgi:hypothetical protein
LDSVCVALGAFTVLGSEILIPYVIADNSKRAR